jgi:hypothetical protein
MDLCLRTASLDRTMIAAAEFANAVAQHLVPVMSSFGLRIASQSGFSTRFEGQEVFVQVDYDAGRSHELNLWVGQKESPEPPFTLADLLRATDCPPDLVSRVDLIQVADAAVLERQLARCTELLVAYGGPFLQGDPHAFADATALRSENARRYTARMVIGATLEKADSAWRRRDYDLVYALLSPISSDLDLAHRRRLNLAVRRRQDRTDE